MPIYAYRCASCDHALDVLQKVSDPLLTVCPSCGQEALRKQLTAAGFQLKGSGWYVTDFRNNGGGAAKPAGGNGAEPKTDTAASTPAPAAAAAPGSSAPGTAAAGAGGGCGSACACH